MPLPLRLLQNALMTSSAKAITPLLIAGSLAALAYAGTCFALYSYQRKLIFRPLPHLIRTPADIGIAYEDVWIPIVSSRSAPSRPAAEKIHGWWLPNPGSSQTLLFCHGNYGNISHNLDRIRFYHSLGFSILAFDYRGYGQSIADSPNLAENLTETVPTEKSTYADAETVWQYLVAERKIRPENITVMGHSMGGAIAIHLATQHPNIAQLIVVSSFTTMQDAVHAKKIYRLFPIQQLLTEPFDSLSKVKKLQVPVLYVHGDQDPDVPTEMSQRLYDASPHPKHIWLAPGAEHNNIAAVAGDSYKETLQAFLNSAQLSTASAAA
jgi:uncharacterized protein